MPGVEEAARAAQRGGPPGRADHRQHRARRAHQARPRRPQPLLRLRRLRLGRRGAPRRLRKAPSIEPSSCRAASSTAPAASRSATRRSTSRRVTGPGSGSLGVATGEYDEAALRDGGADWVVADLTAPSFLSSVPAMSCAAGPGLGSVSCERRRNDEQGADRYLGVPGRVRRGAGSEPRRPAGQGRRRPPRVGDGGLLVARTAWPGGGRGQRRLAGVGREDRGHRRRDHGPEDVQRRLGAVGVGSQRGGLVGRRTAVSAPGLRRHPPRARAGVVRATAPPTTSSPTASSRRSSGRARRPATRTC